MSDKKHWYCITFTGRAIETGKSVASSVCVGYDTLNKWCLEEIKKMKAEAGVKPCAALTNIIYLGEMTEDEFCKSSTDDLSEQSAKQADAERTALVKVIRRKQELERELGADEVDFSDMNQNKYRPDYDYSDGTLNANWVRRCQSVHKMWYTTNDRIWPIIIKEMPDDIKLAMGIGG